MSNIDEIKADFISMYETIKSLDKYKSAVDLQKRLKNKKIQKEKSKSEIFTHQKIIYHCTKKLDTLELHNVKLGDQIENLAIEEYKQVTKEESQQAFEQLLNRFLNSLKFEDKHIRIQRQFRRFCEMR